MTCLCPILIVTEGDSSGANNRILLDPDNGALGQSQLRVPFGGENEVFCAHVLDASKLAGSQLYKRALCEVTRNGVVIRVQCRFRRRSRGRKGAADPLLAEGTLSGRASQDAMFERSFLTRRDLEVGGFGFVPEDALAGFDRWGCRAIRRRRDEGSGARWTRRRNCWTTGLQWT